jgi:hypothetical protein
VYVIHRQYEGIDPGRIDELSRKVNDGLLPRLRKLPGFRGYMLMAAGNGVIRSTSLFDTSGQAESSSRVAAEWSREGDQRSLVPNAPRVVLRRVLAHEATPLLV